MKILSCDVETTTFSKGNPFDSRNKMCLVGLYDGTEYSIYNIEYDDTPYGYEVEEIRKKLDEADLVLFFNMKFDGNHLRKYGINYYDWKIHDCQLAHFILGNQTQPYPSLDETASHYGLGTKLDTIKSYWGAGLQTNEIPLDELTDYLQQDLKLTYEVYLKQIEEIATKPHLAKLINVSMVDTLVLADMEWNGLKYDFTLSKSKAEGLQEQISEIDSLLWGMYPISGLNWNSNDHLSCILYGGLLKIPCREATERTLKDGTIKHGERDGYTSRQMVRLVEPLRGSECAKEGFWKTNVDTLSNLKPNAYTKKLIGLILERGVLEKELNTYALGLPKLYEEYHYADNIIHGRLNQVVARTGRLSSSEPNMQNISGTMLDCFITRF